MLAGSMVTCTEEARGFSASNWSSPLHFVNRPRAFEITMWRTEKAMAEWEGSMFQIPRAMMDSRKGWNYVLRSH